MPDASIGPVPIIAALTALGVVGRTILRRRRQRRFLGMVDRVIARHLRTLSARRRHLVSDDGYGNVAQAKWHDHVDYFVANVLLRDGAVARFFAAEARTGGRPHAAFRQRVIEAVDRHQAATPAPPGGVAAAATGQRYEALCADLLGRHGWAVSTTPATGDQGADLIGAIDGTKVVFQCKFRARPVGNKAVQEAFAAVPFHGADYAAVISNAPYTRSARQLARANGVVLLHHEQLPDLGPAVASWRAERA